MFTLRRQWQQLVERFFDTNMIKTGLSYFLTGDTTKNAHCAICVFDKYYAGFFSDPYSKPHESTFIIFHTEEKYNGNRFLKLTEERLNQLGVTIGFRNTVLDIIADIKKANEV